MTTGRSEMVKNGLRCSSGNAKVKRSDYSGRTKEALRLPIRASIPHSRPIQCRSGIFWMDTGRAGNELVSTTALLATSSARRFWPAPSCLGSDADTSGSHNGP
jgi:hypothetical protein